MSYKEKRYDSCDCNFKCYNFEPDSRCKCEAKPEPECKCELEHKCLPTILEAISTSPQSVEPNLAVPFITNFLNVGKGIIHIPGSTEFILTCPGIYRVNFTGSITAITGDPVVGVALAANGIILPGTTVTETIAVCGDQAALATQALIQVSAFQAVLLTVVNPTDLLEIFTNPNIIIERIG